MHRCIKKMTLILKLIKRALYYDPRYRATLHQYQKKEKK